MKDEGGETMREGEKDGGERRMREEKEWGRSEG